jgi:hypothetical protein
MGAVLAFRTRRTRSVRHHGPAEVIRLPSADTTDADRDAALRARAQRVLYTLADELTTEGLVTVVEHVFATFRSPCSSFPQESA